MTRHRQACTLGLLLFLAASLAGCSEGSPNAPKITGTVPNDGLTPQERKQKSGSAGNKYSRPANYPKPATQGH